LIEEGKPAPKFSLQADDGTIVTLDSVKGKNVVLFFYPKDNTSG
jgi:peroxiredoxin Q/BCP